MNRTLATAVLAIASFAAAPAFAEDITMVNDTFQPTTTRAAVHAEVLKARAAGQVFVSETDLSTTMPSMLRSTLTRDQVRAEALRAPRMPALTYNPAA